ncbi:MAG: HAD family hydrolase [Clostridia bacterium]|nr:HAD family hydrolase [Clostridia bacterium]
MKAVLFDFDGTLVDSMPIYAETMLGILDRCGVSYADDIIKTITPLGTMGTAEYFKKIGVNKSTEEILMMMGEGMILAYSERIPSKAGVAETLRKLSERGYGLHVLTASPHITLDPCLKRLGLYDFFGNVWSCDDFGTTKSDPSIYHSVAERIGLPIEQILFVDDNIHADLCAKGAGMRVCGIFDESSADAASEMKRSCHYYVEEFSQLLDLL